MLYQIYLLNQMQVVFSSTDFDLNIPQWQWVQIGFFLKRRYTILISEDYAYLDLKLNVSWFMSELLVKIFNAIIFSKHELKIYGRLISIYTQYSTAMQSIVLHDWT